MSPKLRVVVATPMHWSTTKGGAEFQAHQIATRFVETGRAEVFYLAKGFFRPGAEYPYHCVPVGSRLPIRAARGTLLDSLRLWSALRRIKPDIVYQRVGCAYTGICGIYARRYGCRFIWHIAHDYDITPKEFAGTGNHLYLAAHKWLLERGIADATHIVAQTSKQASLLKQHYARSDATVIRNAHPLPDIPLIIANRRKIVWIGNFKPIKRPEIYIRLARALSDLPNIEFVMAGAASWNGDWQSKLDADIDQISNLSYVGALSQEEVNALLESAILLVSTSRAEGFPNTFIQAWMRGVPVISLGTDPDNLIRDRHLGIIVNDEAQLESSVRRVVGDPVLRSRLGSNAQTYAKGAHGPQNFETLLSLLMDAGDNEDKINPAQDSEIEDRAHQGGFMNKRADPKDKRPIIDVNGKPRVYRSDNTSN
ncbi:hypothetical protein THIOKS11100008 [Thiocapsa sp. KS1]|nr:glycosyltransferase family 4 protein [Thiocapsa sp. KS1]CRI62995.1 hypothetical protein THIOKS11100008 [Thiocapsa sp. KS1]